MVKSVIFSFDTTAFDVNYVPDEKTRFTTNFANLARTDDRVSNLTKLFDMINDRLNSLLCEEGDNLNRYQIVADIVTINATISGHENKKPFPVSEFLNTRVIDTKTGHHFPGAYGCNFSSYVRDYDFNIVLPAFNKNKSQFSVPDDFGRLHGRLFQLQLQSDTYASMFAKNPLIVLSVSETKTYTATDNHHPVLGVEYYHSEPSLTSRYFGEMGLNVRYFMPKNCCAPLAFYHNGNIKNDYSIYDWVSVISVMETFQKIYRPEIYNSNTVAATVFSPSLKNTDYSRTAIGYDREERTYLGVEQGKYAASQFIKPNREILESILSKDWIK